MEARNITVVSTSNQNKYVVNTDATTLSELKAALRAQGIAYEGMTFYEGLSHTELLTDEAILPHDVPFKGETTNELVFMLTTPNKKIKSGANLSETREALYDAINELNLREVCISTYGKNFTQCKNSELMALIEEAQAKANASDSNLQKAFLRLVDALVYEDLISDTVHSEIYTILNSTKEAECPKSAYSDEDINAMFNFLKD